MVRVSLTGPMLTDRAPGWGLRRLPASFPRHGESQEKIERRESSLKLMKDQTRIFLYLLEVDIDQSLYKSRVKY